jgi:hypothetical protein
MVLNRLSLWAETFVALPFGTLPCEFRDRILSRCYLVLLCEGTLSLVQTTIDIVCGN